MDGGKSGNVETQVRGKFEGENYRVCHGFRLTERVAYFLIDFDLYFWMQLGQYLKLARAQKRTTIGIFSLPKNL